MKLMLIGLLLCRSLLAGVSDLPFAADPKGPYFTDVASRRGKLEAPPMLVDANELNTALFSEIQEQNQDLKKVKYYLINGESRLAQVHLSKLAYTHTKLRPIIYRYLATLNFMEGQYQKSFERLSAKELLSSEHYRRVCVLQILNEVVLNKRYELEKDWERCKQENYNHFQTNTFVWLETMVEMKLNPKPGLTKVPFKKIRLAALDNANLKIFLKLALFLNQEKLLEPQINELDVGQLEDPEVREMVGQVYFRMGSLAKSYRFIEDLNSPNAENMKGNLYVLRKKYELAYAQFKLALEKKSNSQNAMERILPLAWLLGDWKEGSKIAERVIASPQTQINKMTLVAAFLTQKGDYEKAKQVLEGISVRSRRGTEIDVTQLHSFVGLMQNKPSVARKQSALSCANHDLVNCWISFQLEQWDTFALTIRRDEKLVQKKEWEKLADEDLNDPLKETVYVNQLDIEELDDKLIQLIPNAKN